MKKSRQLFHQLLGPMICINVTIWITVIWHTLILSMNVMIQSCQSALNLDGHQLWLTAIPEELDIIVRNRTWIDKGKSTLGSMQASYRWE